MSRFKMVAKCNIFIRMVLVHLTSVFVMLIMVIKLNIFVTVMTFATSHQCVEA